MGRQIFVGIVVAELKTQPEAEKGFRVGVKTNGMKNLVIILIACFCIFGTPARSQVVVNKDSAIGALMAQNSQLLEKYSKAVQQAAGTTVTDTTHKKENVKCCGQKISGWEKLLSFLPVVLYVIMMLIMFNTLKKGGYKISDALKENEPVTIATTTTTTNADGSTSPNISSQDIQPNSSSRLIAFFTGLTTLTLLACITSYWMYKSFVCCQPVDLSKLTVVFITLGLGIVPYGANKVASIFKN